ncbi:hypothetical protein [Halobaculum lipolyticum]|uniref:XapX domain-containing protein n=1 Tax=Halobaculum lipolyticum TaxID=3032001 RepID=A0ABD5WDN3_9EURY|nr:hypothetical protein [Halobaculum sp. DT31]
MDRTFLASVALTALSFGGYVAGIAAPYPGREASLVGLMVGVTLTAVSYGRDGGTVTGGGVGRSDAGESTDGSGDPATASATASATDRGERR